MSDDPPENADDENGEYQLPEISPELRAEFDKIDALFAGMSRAEALDALARFFIDADGEPRIRHKLHLVRSDHVTGTTVGSSSGSPQVDGPADAEPSNDGRVHIRDTDPLTPDDRERGERTMESVWTGVERRRADRANGVVELSRERMMRRRRREGLPTPD